MYSLGLKEQRDRLHRDLERYQRRVVDPPTPEAQERLLLRVHGRTRDQMADGYHERAGSWVQERLAESADQVAADARPSTSTSTLRPRGEGPSALKGGRPDPWHAECPVNEPFNPGEYITSTRMRHTFRADRDEAQELGPRASRGTMSGSRYVPRAYYRGGGELQRGRAVRVDGPDRPATVSCEATLRQHRTVASVYGAQFGRVDGQGRLRQPPYANPKYFLRKRLKAKEIHPRMRYGPSSEMERINDAVAQQGIGLALEPFGDSADRVLESMEARGGWRPPQRARWQAGRFNATVCPADGAEDKALRSLTGQPHAAALGSSLPYAEARRNMAREESVDPALGLFDPSVVAGRIRPATDCRVTRRLCRSVSPTHSPVQGLSLPPTASAEDRWGRHAGRKLYAQSMRDTRVRSRAAEMVG